MTSLEALNTAIEIDRLEVVQQYRRQQRRTKSDRAIIWDATAVGAYRIVAYLLDEGQDANSLELTDMLLMEMWLRHWRSRARENVIGRADGLKKVAKLLIAHGAHFDNNLFSLDDLPRVLYYCGAEWAGGAILNGVYPLPFVQGWRLGFRLPGMTNDKTVR